ncbi:unnamed protein product [Effrenium voratum]|uniref:Uncharacterized protein n=1 Tax=Effrenium voratum TaxID=2562239 RepID=A0AA36N9S9_9DINO|nr:unnamed protein product [Effrenium voratum]
MVMHKLLIALGLALTGSVWLVGNVLCALLVQYPWLWHFLKVFCVSTAFFGGALLFLLSWLAQFWPKDLMAKAEEGLNLSIFELVEILNRIIMRPLYDAVRVLLLINADLDEGTRKEILEEMSPAFRRRVFQCSVAQLLPHRIQKLIYKDTPKSCTDKATMQDIFGDKTEIDPNSPPASSRLARSRSRSLTDLLDFMRTTEVASQKTRQSSVVQKILASKVSDGAIWTMSQGAVHQYESHLSQRVHNLVERINKEPETRLLRLPWRILRWEANMAASVLTSMVSYFAAPEEKRD